MNQTHALRNLAAALLGRLRFVVVCTILFGAAALFAAEFWIPFRYETYASLYVRAGSEQTGNVNLSDLNASKSLAGTYVAVLTSRTVMDEVSRQLLAMPDKPALWDAFPGADAAHPPDVSRSVKISAVNGTEVMRITANTGSPEVSARICNILTEIAPSYLVRVVGAGSVEVIDEAVPIYKPVFPNIPLVTLAGAVLGLCFSVLTALSANFFDDTVREAERLSKTFSKPILGEIQNVDADEKKARRLWGGSASKKRKRRRKRDAAAYKRGAGSRKSRRSRRKLITDENIPFSIVEGYKSIRTNVVFALGAVQSKTIVVSSAAPHEGKSTTAANIALAFSQISGRVLLIDADMRKPVMHRTFVADNSTGLSTLIISLSSIEDSIRRHAAGNLDLLPSGPLPPNPSELLASAQFQKVMETLSERYDYIIIDTPPMNVVSDAIVIRGAGGVMLVARYAQSTYEEIAGAMKKIELSGANMLGFVLNDVERRPSGYYRYGRYGYYGYEYDYGYGYSRRRNQGATANAVSSAVSAATAGNSAPSDAAFESLIGAEPPGAAPQKPTRGGAQSL
ncbi:MAG: polysaccharide biosynthesis tyrosine autokinase [Oscillibacter sp.]|nr:polysaccharide biosynthesis tyrosine autokinase [Oscillibacter sp.]